MIKKSKNSVLILFTLVFFLSYIVFILPKINIDSIKDTNPLNLNIFLNNPIFIDDSDPNHNWNKIASENEWCSGNGTISNPYVIENIIIDGMGASHCIEIRNSNVSFIIRNCTVYNSGLIVGSSGILLDKVNNGILINNNCSYNGRSGISLHRSNNNTISTNIVYNNGEDGISISGYGNKILKNNVSYNRFNGLDLWDCYNNNVSKNHLSYNGDNGIYVNRATNNTIIRNNASYNSENGIDLSYSEKNLVSGNNVNFNSGDGIHLNSDNNIILKNIANHNNLHGIHLIYCKNNILEENLMYKCGLGIFGTYSSIVLLSTNDVDTTNKINDKPIYYYTSMSGLNSDDFSNAGQVILIGCRSSIVSDLNVSFGSCAIFLYKCNNITVSNIDASFNTQNGIYSYDCKYLNIIQNEVAYNRIYYHGNGIHLRDCNYCNILENNINNNYYGIWIYHGNNTVVSENIVEDNGDKGIYIDNCVESSVSGNILNNNTNGIQISNSGIQISNNGYGNDIIMNTVLNSYNGINLRYTDYNTVSGNTVNNNNIGIMLTKSNYNTILGNTANNNNYGISLSSYSNDNTIYFNNFIGNNENVYSSNSANKWISPGKIIYTYKGKNYTGFLGNYWDDYTGSDANNDGIGDTPYTINGDIDKYPLMEPIEYYQIIEMLDPSEVSGGRIPGYNLFFLLGFLSVVAILLSKKLKKATKIVGDTL